MLEEEFKKDIAQIRKNAEQNLIGALTRFRERQTERNRGKLKKAEQKKNAFRARNQTMPNLSKTGWLRPKT